MLGLFKLFELFLVVVAVDNVSGEGELIVRHSFTAVGNQISLQPGLVCDLSRQVSLHPEHGVSQRPGAAVAVTKRLRGFGLFFKRLLRISFFEEFIIRT